MLTMTDYWETITRRREQLGMSRDELAREAKVTASYIYRIEKGEVLTPSYQTAKALAMALGLPLEEMMGDKNPEPMQGDSWLLRLVQEVAPKLSLDEAKEFLRRANRLGTQGRKAALAMLIGLAQSEGSNEIEKAEG